MTGMLWFDNSKTEEVTKIKNAITYYIKKYNKTPILCMVNDRNELVKPEDFVEIEIKKSKTIMPFHYWIVSENDGEKDDGKHDSSDVKEGTGSVQLS